MTSFSFPLALSDFLDLLPIASLSIDNPEQVQASGTGGGEIITSELAPQLWTGEIKLGRMTRSEAFQAGALIDMVRGFMVYDMTRRGPAFDPDGSYIAAYSPTISALNADNLQIKISGLPAYYTLTRGDMLGWQYGASPVRHALHRVASISVSADTAGVTGWVEMTTHIRSGVITGTAIDLVRASCKAILIPRTSTTGTATRTITDGAAFRFIQTLR